MNLNRYRAVGRAGLMLSLLAALSAQANLADLFTNLNAHVSTAKPRLPSIIFIQCDSLGYLDLSSYGQKKFTTPNLDSLAAQGMRFTNYDAAGLDGPSVRAAFLLGSDTGAINGGLPAGRRTVTEILKAGGYHTGLIGEWNFGSPETGGAPWQHGFDEFAGYLTPEDAENYYADFMWRFAPLSVFNETNHTFDTYVGRESLYENDGGARRLYIPDLLAKAALGFVKINRPSTGNHYRPFFLWLDYASPRPNRAEAARTGNGQLVPTDAPYSEEAWPQMEKNRAAMISRMDEDIGQLLLQLKTLRMTNNVAIFFSSATVPRLADGVDPTFFPSVVSTNDVRLPMIAWWPQHIPAGRVSDQHWSPGNFLATAAQISLTDYPTNDVENSILPVLYGKSLNSLPAQK